VAPHPLSSWLAPGLAVAAPLALAVLEVFHPHPGDLLRLDTGVWLLVHYLQILLFPLAALAMTVLVRGRSDPAAHVCRVAMFVFAVSAVAFDVAAGVVTGVLSRAAQASPAPEAWRDAIATIWSHPIIGGSREGAPVLAVVATLAWLVGSLAAALACHRAGSSWGPVVLLVISGLGLLAFRTHAWPGGPLSFGAQAGAAAWRLAESDMAGVSVRDGRRPA